MQSIDTYYDGRFFRSRLEARWAVFFNMLCIPYEYEKEGYKLRHRLYLPDFWMPQQQCFVEIKGDIPNDSEKKLAGDLAVESGKPVYIFFGDIPPVNHYTESAYKFFPEEGYDYDLPYKWCVCPDCDTFGIELNGRSDRLPCKPKPCPTHGAYGDKHHTCDDQRILDAFYAARSARFEFLEQGVSYA